MRASKLCCPTLVLGALLASSSVVAQDLAILNGRVMDPETGLDAVRQVAIEDGRITAVSSQRPSAAAVIDASGLIVAPGFIDLHAHGQDMVSNRFQAADGVTTALALELGVHPVAEWYESRRGEALIHYGATVGHFVARYSALEGKPGSASVLDPAAIGAASARRPATAGELERAVALLEQGLRDGALGFGVGITYTPGASHEELFDVFAAAARLGAPIFIHMRAAARVGGDYLAPIQEVIANAVATGASVHVVHLNSSTDESARPALRLIRAARENGVDVTTESYPYTAGSTLIESAIFDAWEGDYAQLQWAATGERLTEESFRRYRGEGGYVIIHGRSEQTNEWLVQQPDVIAASDGISFSGGRAHPRGAGTFARILGHYVRERRALDLMTALGKMTLLPAQRLEAIAPQMKRKGRVQVGADADLTLFDPETVLDRASYEDSMQLSAGIRHVLVGGVLVVRDGELVEGVAPGQPVWGRLRER